MDNCTKSTIISSLPSPQRQRLIQRLIQRLYAQKIDNPAKFRLRRKELLKKLRIIAARRSTSVSRLLADELVGLVEKSGQYEQSKRHTLAVLDAGFHFGG